MLDYKDIIIKHYALHMSGRQIAAAIGASKSGVNDFLKAFEQCESLLGTTLVPDTLNFTVEKS